MIDQTSDAHPVPEQAARQSSTNQTPEPGQIWADNDRRSNGRYLRVLSIEDGSALVKQVTAAGESTLKAPTRIRLNRFRPTSTGYRLVRHADGSAA
ncbi:hypothetical protein [Streptomyces sp. CA-111067]|uniref:hypothetical protein n=1 Tax=Streptomyces sp. CA-111067 TaxID=3240046 RepID=UPI003D983A63